MNVTDSDLHFVKSLFDKYNYKYEVREDHIRCHNYSYDGYSYEGIKLEKEWNKIYETICNKFGKRLMEVYHCTCLYHLDFKIYLRSKEVLREEKIKRLI